MSSTVPIRFIGVCSSIARFVSSLRKGSNAEVPIDPATDPDMPDSYFASGSLVFQKTEGPVNLHDFRQWWAFIPGADWQHPEGPGSTIDGRENHPVVHVSLFDAQAYANWARFQLPTEAEWEFAARDGVTSTYPWGEDLVENELRHANTWKGAFPWLNDHTENAPYSVAVDAFQPSRYGLFNIIGNVWEWTTTTFATAHDPGKFCCTPARFEDGQNFVVKGGSFLCAASYCKRYRATARSPQEARSSTSHLGFRCIRR
jgi:sulfatase modifying factor 1